MLFQVLDDKINCVGIYTEDGNLVYGKLPVNNLTKTWRYAQFLKNHNVEYARLRCGGKTLSEVCPEYLKNDWERASSKLKAFMLSFKTAKVDLRDNCFFDLVPENFLKEFCEIKNKITTHVIETYPRPPDYDFLVELEKLVTDIKYQNLNIDKSALLPRMHEAKVRKFCHSNKSLRYVRYNVFGGKTGRLTTLKDSFPILNIDRMYRCIIKPVNDFFVELDFNAAELRMMLALLGKSQPSEDLHEWNRRNIFKNKLPREKAKYIFFSWLYNPTASNLALESVYDKNVLIDKFWNGKTVKTVYHKIIPSDRWHALNYILQSSTASMVLRQILKLYKFLRGKKSFISYMIHDNVVIDMTNEENFLIKEMIDIFSETEFGRMKVKVSIGKDAGNLKPIEQKN